MYFYWKNRLLRGIHRNDVIWEFERFTKLYTWFSISQKPPWFSGSSNRPASLQLLTAIPLTSRAFLWTALTNEPSKQQAANELCLLFFRSDAVRKRYRLSVVVVNSHLPLTGGRGAYRTRLFCSSIAGNCRLAVVC